MKNPLLSVLIPLFSSACAIESSLSTIDKTTFEPDTGLLDEVENLETEEEEPEESDVPESTHDLETEEDLEIEPPPEDDCTETSDLIYTVDRDSQTMYLFDPTNNSFSSLGSLPCDDWGWEGDPGSMGVM